MPNGDEMMSDMKLEKMIKNWTPAEQFLARQVMDIRRTCEDRLTCPATLKFTKKQIGIGISGVTFLAALVELVVKLAAKI